MKRMKIIALLIMLLTTNGMFMQQLNAKVNKQQVVFYVNLHCQGCIDKVYKTIAYEKGVKDLKCDLNSKTVVVTYDANKTDIPTLQKAFAAIGKPATTTPPTEEQLKETESNEDHNHHTHHN